MLRVLWELRNGPIGFRALQARCDVLSPTVLNTRLSELHAAGLVEQDHTRVHQLTRLGEDLLASLAPLNNWSQRSAETTETHSEQPEKSLRRELRRERERAPHTPRPSNRRAGYSRSHHNPAPSDAEVSTSAGMACHR